MASPASSAEFLDLVRKSGVVDEKRLDAHIEKLRAATSLPTEPGKLAGILVRDGLLTHFQAEQFMLGKWRRFTIGKYKVLERLGSGGMGSVYLCEHKLMRRRVAVKVLPTAKATDPAALERFYREARAVAALDHPNIVHAYDIDQDENLHFLVMEYVDGASLQEIIKKAGPLSPVRAAHYISQATLGLQHAHTAGLIHRDIKPGNVLVDRTGLVKILDMGLARFFNDEEDILTKKYDENVLGTADYLAPEQAVDSHGVDIRADIYSLGATFYFILTGKTPFSEGTVAQKLIWHQTRQPKPIRTLRPEVPEEMTAVVERMMAKDPAQRYQAPAEIAEALAPWTQEAIAPPPETEMPRLSLAATGVSPGETTTVSSVPPGAPSPAPRKNWQVPPSGTGSKPPPRTSDTRGQMGPATNATARPAASTPTPKAAGMQPGSRANGQPGRAPAPSAPEEESIPWERLTTDTDDPTGRVDTAPRSSRKNLSPSRSRPGGKSGVFPPPDRRRIWWVLGIVSVLVLAVLAGLWWWLVVNQPKKNPGRPPLRVNKAGQGNELKSIKEALDRARRGDRIVVVGGTYPESIVLHGKPDHRDLTIEAEGEVIVVPAPEHDARYPLLDLKNADGIRIKGLKFDGQGRVENLVSLTFRNPGVILEGLRLEKFKASAVKISNCLGKKDRPVELLNLTITPSDLNNPKPAVVFFLDTRITTVKSNDHIHIENCTFKGAYTPANPAIKHTGNILGSDVKFPGR